MRSTRRFASVAGTFAAAAILGVSVLTLAPSVLAATPRYGNLHVVKECRAFTGAAGDYCTVTSSNIPAIKVGSKIVYGQAAGATALNSDIVLTSGAGNRAIGHCYLGFADGLGLCTIAGGTGAFAGFEASVTVTANSTVTKGWNWDGTYSFDSPN
jgi:hypothetical protein